MRHSFFFLLFMENIPHPPLVADRPQRERVTLTQEQLAAIRAGMTEQEVREYLGEPELSKAKISRIRNGEDFYHRHYSVAEYIPNPHRADSFRTEIVAAAQRGVEHALTVLLQGGHISPDTDPVFLAQAMEDAHNTAEQRLRELAGHDKFTMQNWRNRVTFNVARRRLLAVIEEMEDDGEANE